MKEYNDINQNGNDDLSDSHNNGFKIFCMFMIICVIMTAIFICYYHFGISTLPASIEVDKETEPSSDISSDVSSNFIKIDDSGIIVLQTGDALSFESPKNNDKDNVSINLTIENAKTHEYYCDTIINGFGSFKWVPSDYINSSGTYIISVSQKAYASSDLTKPIGTLYNELTIELEK